MCSNSSAQVSQVLRSIQLAKLCDVLHPQVSTDSLDECSSGSIYPILSYLERTADVVTVAVGAVDAGEAVVAGGGCSHDTLSQTCI